MNPILTSHNSCLSPFEKLCGHAPNYFALCVFRCTYFVLKPHNKHAKLSTKSNLYMFLGYGLGQKKYHCFIPVSKKLYVSHHVVLLEHIPFYSMPASLHYLTTSDVIKIDHFDIYDTTPTSIPTPEPILTPITNIAPEVVPIDFHYYAYSITS